MLCRPGVVRPDAVQSRRLCVQVFVRPDAVQSRCLCVQVFVRPDAVRPYAVPSTPSHAYTHPMSHTADTRQRERAIRAQKFAPILFFLDEMPYSKTEVPKKSPAHFDLGILKAE